MEYLTVGRSNILNKFKQIGVNEEFLDFLVEYEVDLEIIYLCLFFNVKNTKTLEPLNFSHLNDKFEGINKVCDLKIDFSLGNTHEDYRNLVVILSKDIKALIAILYIRLYVMNYLKKVEFENKKEFGYNTLYVYAPLAHRLGMGRVKTPMEDLSLYFMDLDKFKNIVKKLEVKQEKRQREVHKMIEDIKRNLDSNINFKIYGRSKSIYSIYKKLYESKKNFDDIYDFQGIRILCDTKEECYAILGLIHEMYEPLPYRFKDYILLKKANLYQSIHTSVVGQDKNVFEIQIRTYKMDEIAERGIAAHWLYKEGKNSKNKKDIEENLHLFREDMKQENFDQKSEDLFKSVIYTYTPTGKFMILQAGSCVIDFAYRIHTNVAQNMVSAIVNKRIVPFSHVLVNGDVVQIKTQKNICAVQKDWLDIVVSAHAKKKIKSFINKEKTKFLINQEEEGKKLLNYNYRHGKLKYDILNDKEIQNIVLKSLSYKTINKVYSDFYDKKISLKDINNIDITNFDTLNFKNKIVKNKKKSKFDVAIPGIDSIKISFSNCCHPIYGDHITGLIKNGREVSIHKKDCKNIQNANILDVEWKDENKYKYISKIVIETMYDTKVLNNIINSLAKESVAIKAANYKVHEKVMKIDMEIEVLNVDILNNVMNILRNIGENTIIRRV